LLIGETPIATTHSEAQESKPKTNVDLLLAKAIRLCAEAGYRLTIERAPKAPLAVDNITALEEWKRGREG
jgi:hypothetical protein